MGPVVIFVLSREVSSSWRLKMHCKVYIRKLSFGARKLVLNIEGFEYYWYVYVLNKECPLSEVPLYHNCYSTSLMYVHVHVITRKLS